MRNDASGQEQELIESILQFKYDPLGFVLFAFPWGQVGTPLANVKSPRRWQVRELESIGEQLAVNTQMMSVGLPPKPVYVAIGSGRGIGKSAFFAMLDMWMMSCWLGGTGIISANSENQLKSRTMAELGKWHTMSINSHWFEKSSLSLKPAAWFAELVRKQLKIDTQYYYIEGQTWNEENPDAFAGAHSQIAMMVLFDEASGIPDSIWDVTEGFFTDMAELRLWVVISNPRKTSGKFYDAFHKDKAFWRTMSIDSRTVEGVDTGVYQRIVDKYGEDHDVTKVEVKGQFPKTGSDQFISRLVLDDAQMRQIHKGNDDEPLLMGVDVARFGDDDSVIRLRKGRDARSFPVFKYRGLDTMTYADKVARLIDQYDPDGVFVDGGGVGGGVVDRLRQLGYDVIEVTMQAQSLFPNRYLNKRAEIYDELKLWLETGCIDHDSNLDADLITPKYEYVNKGQLKLEGKKDMKKRLGRSPDDGDALALTFAQSIAKKRSKKRKYNLSEIVVPMNNPISRM